MGKVCKKSTNNKKAAIMLLFYYFNDFKYNPIDNSSVIIFMIVQGHINIV